MFESFNCYLKNELFGVISLCGLPRLGYLCGLKWPSLLTTNVSGPSRRRILTLYIAMGRLYSSKKRLRRWPYCFLSNSSLLVCIQRTICRPVDCFHPNEKALLTSKCNSFELFTLQYLLRWLSCHGINLFDKTKKKKNRKDNKKNKNKNNSRFFHSPVSYTYLTGVFDARRESTYSFSIVSRP